MAETQVDGEQRPGHGSALWPPDSTQARPPDSQRALRSAGRSNVTPETVLRRAERRDAQPVEELAVVGLIGRAGRRAMTGRLPRSSRADRRGRCGKRRRGRGSAVRRGREPRAAPATRAVKAGRLVAATRMLRSRPPPAQAIGGPVKAPVNAAGSARVLYRGDEPSSGRAGGAAIRAALPPARHQPPHRADGADVARRIRRMGARPAPALSRRLAPGGAASQGPARPAAVPSQLTLATRQVQKAQQLQAPEARSSAASSGRRAAGRGHGADRAGDRRFGQITETLDVALDRVRARAQRAAARGARSSRTGRWAGSMSSTRWRYLFLGLWPATGSSVVALHRRAPGRGDAEVAGAAAASSLPPSCHALFSNRR